MKTVCMVVQNPRVKGGIASVINGYRGSQLEQDFHVIYVESYMDGSKLAKFLKGVTGYLRFFKILITDRPDLVHIHSSFGPSFYRKIPFIIMSGWFKTPLINHIHGADFEGFYINASFNKKKLIRKYYGKCSRLIALSAEWKNRLENIVPSEKIDVIENYGIIDEDVYKERMNRKCNNTVLFLGELGQRKGCFDIPSVVEKVKAVIPSVRFVLCGEGKEEKEIKNLVTVKGIEKHVIFPGWVRGKTKKQLLQNADIFFLPSYNEGMPMSILEALGFGLPIVSTNVGGIPELVHDGINGFCCKPGDIEGFSEGIIELLNNDEMRSKAAEASLFIVKEKYSLEAHLKLLKKIYDEEIEKVEKRKKI